MSKIEKSFLKDLSNNSEGITKAQTALSHAVKDMIEKRTSSESIIKSLRAFSSHVNKLKQDTFEGIKHNPGVFEENDDYLEDGDEYLETDEPIVRFSSVKAGPRDYDLTCSYEDGHGPRVIVVSLSGVVHRQKEYARLKDVDAFNSFKLGWQGSFVDWDDYDLSLSAEDMIKMSSYQSDWSGDDFAAWMGRLDLSINDVTDLLGMSRGTIISYKKKDVIPTAIMLACRQLEDEPMCLFGRLTPRLPGRPGWGK